MKLRDLERLKPLQQRLSFLPARGKRPLQDNWPNQSGLTVEELLRYPDCSSVGVRTGPQHGPLAIFDIDGDTALELGCSLGMEPWSWITWQVHRREAPNRLKLFCIPTRNSFSSSNVRHSARRSTPSPPSRTTRAPSSRRVKGWSFSSVASRASAWGSTPMVATTSGLRVLALKLSRLHQTSGGSSRWSSHGKQRQLPPKGITATSAQVDG